MNHTNIVLYLKTGESIKVIYPHHVFTEYHTPWLERPGGVQTSDPEHDLAQHNTGNYFTNANFVISTWKNFPKYLSANDGRIRTIPMFQVRSITVADPTDAEIGNKIRQQEDTEREDKSYRNGVVTRQELAALFPDLAQRILTRSR